MGRRDRKGGLQVKQSERRERRRSDILAAAMQGFADGYERASIDSLCLRHGISKGAMYHYFSGRDDLFLACVEAVFANLCQYLEETQARFAQLDAAQAIGAYFLCREDYFAQHPQEKGVFESALVRTPKHLREQIHALRAPLRAINQRFLRQTIARLPLREGITLPEAERYFESVEALFWEFFRYEQALGGDEQQSPLVRMERLLDMFLFGVAAQPGA